MRNVLMTVGLLCLLSCNKQENKTQKTERVNKISSLNVLENIKPKDPSLILYEKVKDFAYNGYLDSAIIYSDSIISLYPESPIIGRVYIAKDEYVSLKERHAELNKNIKALQKRTITKKDEFSSTSYIETNKFTHYTNTNLISIYLAKNSYGHDPYLMLSYTGDDWIFFEDIYLKSGDDILQVLFNKYEDKKTDNNSKVWEWINMRAAPEIIDFLEEAANSGELKIRLSGKYVKDRTVSKKELSALKDIIQLYRLSNESKSINYKI